MAEDKDYEIEDEKDLDVADEDEQDFAEGGEVDDGDDSHESADDSNDDGDEDREGIRARRRQERQDKKRAAREREDSLKRELAARDEIINQLQSRVAVVERHHQGSEEAQIETSIQEAADAYNYFKGQIAISAQENDGAGIADATEKMILAQRRYEDLNRVKTTYQESKTNKQQPLDPRLVNQAKAWMERNKWYDPNGGDADSRRALEIDRELAREGWVPTTPQYWEELESRVKKNLPHRGKTNYNSSKSVVTGSGRESAPSGNGGTYKLSSERVAALKDSGMWDDPKQRAEAIKRFKEYDRANGQR
jgi:hypothetical protein